LKYEEKNWKLVFLKSGNKCLKNKIKNYIISKFITFENIIFSIFEKKSVIYNFQIKKNEFLKI